MDSVAVGVHTVCFTVMITLPKPFLDTQSFINVLRSLNPPQLTSSVIQQVYFKPYLSQNSFTDTTNSLTSNRA